MEAYLTPTNELKVFLADNDISLLRSGEALKGSVQEGDFWRTHQRKETKQKGAHVGRIVVYLQSGIEQALAELGVQTPLKRGFEYVLALSSSGCAEILRGGALTGTHQGMAYGVFEKSVLDSVLTGI